MGSELLPPEPRRRHYSYRTEQSYLVWLEQFARFYQTEALQSRGTADIKAFLDALALDALDPAWALMTRVALGGGLCLMELLRLRVKDVDWEQESITVHGCKGDRDRFVPLAHIAVEPLRVHLGEVR